MEAVSPSLREDLGGTVQPVPPFVLLLPPGWVSLEPTRDVFDDLAARASAVFRSQHRPDLDAQFRSMVASAADEFLSRDPVRIIMQRDVPAELMLPVTIMAARLSSPDGASLDARVGDLVRSQGAHPLDDRGVIMKWSSTSDRETEAGRVGLRGFNYLVPVPETGRRQAVLFTASVPARADGEALGEDYLERLELVIDAVMSTFRWSA